MKGLEFIQRGKGMNGPVRYRYGYVGRDPIAECVKEKCFHFDCMLKKMYNSIFCIAPRKKSL